jgi:RNA polymerase sigma-70 factor, ECF subfamily
VTESAVVEASVETVGTTVNSADIEALFEHYAGLRALILRQVRDPELAADLLQDAAVTTLTKLRRGEIDRPEQIGGYIYRVALNHLRNYRRKDRSAMQVSDGLEDIPGPNLDDAVDTLRRDQWSKAAARVLAELPVTRDREILVRYYLDEEDRDSICAALHLTEEHFHRVIFRARVRFRTLLENRGFRRSDFLGSLLVVLSLAGLIGVASGCLNPIADGVASTPSPAAATSTGTAMP